MKLYKDYTKKIFSFLVNDRTLPSDNSLRYRKQLPKHDKKINSILGSCGFGLFDLQLILTLNSFFSTKPVKLQLSVPS